MKTSPKRAKKLSRQFYLQEAETIAYNLVGKILVRDDGRMGRIVETEAYNQDDEASHTYKGKSKRNEAMFMEGGHLYVYFTYGCHFCANVVAGPFGYGSGVLLRAVEPLGGIPLMQQARGKEDIHQLCSGPGKLAQAFGIDKKLYGIDLTSSSSVLSIKDDGFSGLVIATTRIGISKAQEKPWRFVLDESSFVSKKASGV